MAWSRRISSTWLMSSPLFLLLVIYNTEPIQSNGASNATLKAVQVYINIWRSNRTVSRSSFAEAEQEQAKKLLPSRTCVRGDDRLNAQSQHLSSSLCTLHRECERLWINQQQQCQKWRTGQTDGSSI